MEWIVYLALVLIGVCLGSFAGATVWRLRARELKIEKASGARVDHMEYKRLTPLMKRSFLTDRSRCLHCSYTLKWYDLIPVISWLGLKGKCRNCKKPIGSFELLIELGVAAFFVISYAFWPFPLDDGLQIARFIIWLAAGVALAILFSYDKKWFLLPDRANLVVIGLGIITVAITAAQSGNVLGTLLTALGAVGILSGLYLSLYVVSKGRWVGFGDVKLGLGLGLLLVDWQLAIVALFLANFIGCLIVIPLLALGKLKRNSHVPFGPLLIAGAVVAQFAGPTILELYLTALI
jgi:prepilin signal peptidase PulO-like enzyme (type II secretory pathway)